MSEQNQPWAGGQPAAYVPGNAYAGAPGARYALRLDNAGSYSRHGDVYAKEHDEAFSVSGWIFPTSATDGGVIVGKMKGPAYVGWKFALYPDAGLFPNFSFTDDSVVPLGLDVYTTLGNALPINRWHHVAMTYDGSGTVAGVKFYIDGASQAVDPTNYGGGDFDAGSTISDAPFTLGATSDDAGLLILGGLLTAARIHDRVLTAAEVLALYQGTQPAPAVEGEWLMTDGSGTTLSANRGPNGTITSPVWNRLP